MQVCLLLGLLQEFELVVQIAASSVFFVRKHFLEYFPLNVGADTSPAARCLRLVLIRREVRVGFIPAQNCRKVDPS